jgi:tRNA (uracil-5-)-methyltransferase
VVPFAHPGDKIRAKVFKHDRFCSFADFVDISERSTALRGGEGDRTVNPDKGCQYFGTCGGCQLQDVPYPLQLQHKLRTVDLAYKRFSGLSAAKVPEILPTIGSPLQWGYRTKITPHFDAVPKWARPKEKADGAEEEAGNDKPQWECKIGFDRKGKPGVLDIEVSYDDDGAVHADSSRSVSLPQRC